MRYYKLVIDNFIMCAPSTTARDCGVEIDIEEYDAIVDAIRGKPSAPSGYTYKLRADTLEWELVELPPEPDPGEEDATAEDYEAALKELGVRV
jgi:hypothetical protein